MASPRPKTQTNEAMVTDAPNRPPPVPTEADPQVRRGTQVAPEDKAVYMVDVTVPSGPGSNGNEIGPGEAPQASAPAQQPQRTQPYPTTRGMSSKSKRVPTGKSKRSSKSVQREQSLKRETMDAYSTRSGLGSKSGRSEFGSRPAVDMAAQIVEELRRQQNEHLLGILEEEQANEAEREIILRDVQDSNDRERLERQFAIERAKASERIMRVTAEHEMVLASRISQLGLE